MASRSVRFCQGLVEKTKYLMPISLKYLMACVSCDSTYCWVTIHHTIIHRNHGEDMKWFGSNRRGVMASRSVRFCEGLVERAKYLILPSWKYLMACVSCDSRCCWVTISSLIGSTGRIWSGLRATDEVSWLQGVSDFVKVWLKKPNIWCLSA
jgi:hypothetical protein